MGIQRYSQSGQNKLLASDIAQEVIDATRNLPWATLVDPNVCNRTYTLLVNGETAGDQSSADFAPRPLLIDQTIMNYSKLSTDGKFRGTVLETIGAPEGDATKRNRTIRITVQIQWPEYTGGDQSVNGATWKRYTYATTIAETGIHN
jgi:hypothetical protein